MLSWDLKPEAARALQTKLACQVIQKSRLRPEGIITLAGVDTTYRDGIAHAAVTVVSLKDLKMVERAAATRTVTYPYVPGLFSFREGPVILDALEKLEKAPDLLMIDGHGIAHPRRCGIASHVGVLLDIPTIGCAKTRLIGAYRAPPHARGSTSFLKDGKEIIGAVVRTRTGVKPLFVSIGHLMDLNDCVRLVLQSCRGYRLPEPLRRAHQLSRVKLTSV